MIGGHGLRTDRGTLRETYLRTYIGVLVAFAVALAASWIYRYGLTLEPHFILGTAIFAAFILLGDMFPIHISERYAVGMWDVGLIVATVVLGLPGLRWRLSLPFFW